MDVNFISLARSHFGDEAINFFDNIGVLPFVSECPWLFDLAVFKGDEYFFDIGLVSPSSLSEVYEKTKLPKFFHTSKLSYDFVGVCHYSLMSFIQLNLLDDSSINSCLLSFYKNNSGSVQHDWSYLIRLQKNHLLWILNKFVGKDGLQIQDIVDFLKANYPNKKDKVKINDMNSMARAIERWHEKLAQDNTDFSNMPEICFGTLPLEVDVDGYKFVALNTKQLLHVEGKIMHHCVSSYYDNSIRDMCRIYSIRDEVGARVATIEIGNNLSVVQVKAKNNNPISKEASRIVKMFSHYLLSLDSVKFGSNVSKVSNLELHDRPCLIDNNSTTLRYRCDGHIIITDAEGYEHVIYQDRNYDNMFSL